MRDFFLNLCALGSISENQAIIARGNKQRGPIETSCQAATTASLIQTGHWTAQGPRPTNGGKRDSVYGGDNSLPCLHTLPFNYNKS